MKTLFKTISIIIISGFLISCILHAHHILRHFYQSSEKTGLIISGPRTDIGDNYYYFTLTKNALERNLSELVYLPELKEEDRRYINPVSNSYATALYLGNAIYKIAAILTNSSREAALLTSILFTCSLAMAFITFIGVLSNLGRHKREWFSISIVSFFGLITIDAFANTMYFGKVYWNPDLLSHYSNPLRMVNPNLFWAIGLFAGVFVVRWLRMQQRRDLVVSIVLVGLTGLSSLSVGLTLSMALGLTVVLYLAVYRTFSWSLIAIFLSSIIGFLWSYFQLIQYLTTPMGQNLQHGHLIGLVISWTYLILLFLLPFLWRSKRKEKIFITSLLVSAVVVGAVCESLHLGGRLWLRGAVVYAWGIVLFIIVNNFWAYCNDKHISDRKRLVFKAIAITLLSCFVLLNQNLDMSSWKGFIQKEKWQMLAWMEKNLPEKAVVASSDIEDAMLLPIYTNQKPIYSMYGLVNGVLDDELKRYFYTMSLFGLGPQAFEAALSISQQEISDYNSHLFGRVPVPYTGNVADAAIFTELVLYHAHIVNFSKDAGGQGKRQYLERLISSSYEKAKNLEYSYDFMIFKKADFLLSGINFPVIYENNSFVILKKSNSS